MIGASDSEVALVITAIAGGVATVLGALGIFISNLSRKEAKKAKEQTSSTNGTTLGGHVELIEAAVARLSGDVTRQGIKLDALGEAQDEHHRDTRLHRQQVVDEIRRSSEKGDT